MRKGQQTEKRDAFALFPDLMQNLFGSSRNKKKEKVAQKPKPAAEITEELPQSKGRCIVPPAPPDLSWLKQGEYDEEREKAEDIPAVLLLPGTDDQKADLSSNWQQLGYRVEMADTSDKALTKLKSITFSAVVLHTEFGGEPLAKSVVHRYLTDLPASKRRALFYILVGPELHTMFDLEALALSANLVVNDEHIHQLQPILRKSFREYEELFGPLIEAFNAYGK